jgi:hypothetical protein
MYNRFVGSNAEQYPVNTDWQSVFGRTDVIENPEIVSAYKSNTPTSTKKLTKNLTPYVFGIGIVVAAIIVAKIIKRNG